MRFLLRALVAATIVTILADRIEAQRTADAAVSRLVERDLSRIARGEAKCASSAFVNCSPGVQLVLGYRIERVTDAGESARFLVIYDVAGVVASSEASMFFIPAGEALADTVVVSAARRKRMWSALVADRGARRQLRMRADLARRFFALDADDRELLDSVRVARPRGVTR